MPQIGPRTSTTFLGRAQDWLAAQGIWGILLMAFIGGFVLNLMPCVLPVISIKVLSFVQQAGESRLRVFTLGMAFSAGILLSFAILGVLIVTAGYQWGGLFQSPHAVLAMCAIVTAFALSLFGVFALQPPRLVTTLGSRVQQEGHLSAFGMGLLATALGTACTAPFLGFALALAVKHPPIVGLLIFLFAGIGMAAPYIALAAHPAWLRFLPRPGPWMKTFEHIMGFMLLGTVVWLLFSVNRQLGGTGLFLSLIFLLFIALASWLYGKAEFGISPVRRLAYYGCALLAVVMGWRMTFSGERSVEALLEKHRAEQRWLAERIDPTGLQWDGPFPWKPYLRQRALDLVREGYTVFVDYTASWCANCLTNERVVIDTPEVREAMERLGVLPLQADYSDRDPEISEDLQKYNRAGVPMYLVYAPGRPDDPIVLDEILTKDALISALEQAGPSRAGRMARTRDDGPLIRTD